MEKYISIIRLRGSNPAVGIRPTFYGREKCEIKG